ncbi:MAG: CHAT domain-containing protein, partial [Bacteroidota bacterium]
MRQDPAFKQAFEALQQIKEAGDTLARTATLHQLYAHHQLQRAGKQAFHEKFANFFTEIEDTYTFDLDILQRELAADSAGVLSLYAAERSLYRVFIAADTIDVVELSRKLPEVQELTEELAQQSANSGRSPATSAETSHQLYQLLFGEIDSLLPERLHLVATGPLIDIPFPALRMSASDQPARYLGVEHALSRQFSIGSMRALARQERAPKYPQPLAFAPAFSGELLAASELRQAGFALNPLLYNQEEVQRLEALGPGNYHYGEGATLADYQKYAADYGIIHLATHAISSKLDGVRSRVYLVDDEGEAEALYAADLQNT